VKASKNSIGRSVDQPDPTIRFYLFHGPDEAGSRALGARLLQSLGAAKFVVSGSAIKSDPASLADEAAAMSLFGGKRAIWIEPATRDIEEAVAALLVGAAPESPAIAIAGALARTSALLKLAEASPAALTYASYAPEGQDAVRMVVELGRRVGLKIDPAVAARVAGAAGNDQAIVDRELEKLALFLDASPQAPKPLDHDAVDAVGAVSSEGDFNRLADSALGGDLARLADDLAALSPTGSEAIPVIRSLQRRLLMLAPMRARIERGESVEAVMTSMGRSLFWKEKGSVERMLKKWSADELSRAAERAGRLEREMMRPRLRPNTALPEHEGLGEELIAIALKARGR
jgi:DNA polymerase III subunit delta